jgi:hypothetical protein
MASMNMRRTHKILFGIALCAVALLALIGSSLFFFLFRGVPLHDFRLWSLERNFRAAALYHPTESMLLGKKTYLGGPYEHGSLRCDFFVGELRSSPLSKDKIRQAYNGGSIESFDNTGPVPLNVLFFDEERWTMNSPLGDWWDEWYGSVSTATVQTVYFVFASQEGYPFLGDLRCDD